VPLASNLGKIYRAKTTMGNHGVIKTKLASAPRWWTQLISTSWRTAQHLPDHCQSLVQLPDRLHVAPRLQVQPEPAHVLEVLGDLLAVRQGKWLGADAARFIDVALLDVGGSSTSRHWPRPL
jgi:hypothetical protein